jgi:hypothetical protein
MKFLTGIGFFCFSFVFAQAAPDHVANYLQLETRPDFVIYRTDRSYFSDDYILRLEIDLAGNGQKLVLISSSRDQDGRQGNVWIAYGNNGLILGTMTFSPSRFYVGPLEGGKYGLATFGPAGAGEGTMWGYVLDGNSINQIKLGGVVLNRQTMKLEGEEILSKYLGEKAIIGDEVMQIIGSKELSEKYRVKVDPRTYREALEEEMQASQHAKVTTSTAPAQTTSMPPMATPDHQPKSVKAPSPVVQAESPKSSPLPWIIGAILFLAVAGGILFKFLRR